MQNYSLNVYIFRSSVAAAAGIASPNAYQFVTVLSPRPPSPSTGKGGKDTLAQEREVEVEVREREGEREHSSDSIPSVNLQYLISFPIRIGAFQNTTEAYQYVTSSINAAILSGSFSGTMDSLVVTVANGNTQLANAWTYIPVRA